MNFQDHFSGHAAVYRDARPHYHPALFAWLAAQVPRRDLAWDAGCGNGQATVALAAHFARVIGSDPSAAQIAHAEPAANVEYRVEPAEQSSLAAASVDLVCVAQALHWFEQERFHAEVRRVLRPGVVIAALAYAGCRIDPAIDRVTTHLYVDLTGPYWPPERAHIEAGYATLPFPYTPICAPGRPRSATPRRAAKTRWHGSRATWPPPGARPRGCAPCAGSSRCGWGGAEHGRRASRGPQRLVSWISMRRFLAQASGVDAASSG